MTTAAPSDTVALQAFADLDRADDIAAYISALEVFDRIAQLQELKVIERERSGITPGSSVLDVGCGFGLETQRIAEQVRADGVTVGIDKSARFVAEAQRRAVAAGVAIDYRVGDAQALPFPDGAFDWVRAERLLIYLDDWERAVGEMRRVTRRNGRLSFIEPDIGTATVNLPDRDMVRRVLAFEADRAVAMSWLPGPLLTALRDGGLADITIDTRVLVFPQGLARSYFAGVGQRAHTAGVLSDAQLRCWLDELARLHAASAAFGTIGYFLFTARVT